SLADASRISDFADRLRETRQRRVCVVSRNRSRFSPIRRDDCRGTVEVVNSTGGHQMETTLDQFRHQVETLVTKARWALVINGALAVAVGVLIIIWPNISLYSLVIVFGAFSLARGIIGLAMAIGSPIREGRGWLVLSSLAGIVVGVVVFLWTD